MLLNHVKKFREVYLFGIVAVMVIFAVLMMVKADLSHKVLQYTSHMSNRDELQFIHDFTSGMEIKQPFSSPQDFDFITLSFSHHDQQMQGKVAVLIADKESGENLIYKELDAGEIKAGTLVEIPFGDVGGGKAEKLYEIILLSVECEEPALGVYGYETNGNPAMVDGKTSEYALSIGIHSYTRLYRNLTLLVLAIGTIAVFGVIAGTFIFHLKEQQMFLLLAIPFSLCMLLFWPGNKVYDEDRHYHTIYHYSNILLGCAGQDTSTEINMRKCDVSDLENAAERNVAINGQAQDYWYYVQTMNDSVEDRGMVLTDVSSNPVVENGTFLEYLPGALGMTLSRLLGCNYFWMMTLTRLVLISFYIAMCYYAIRTIPVMKMAVAFISALPMALYQASGITYDSFTYSVGIIVFALIMKLWSEKLTHKEFIILGAAVFALGSCKGGVYLTLILLMLLIPKEKCGEKKWRKCLTIFFIAGTSMLSSFIPTIIRWFGLGSADTLAISNTELANGNYHIVYAFKNPLEFTKMLILTLIENADTYLGQILGYRTAWSDMTISLAVMLPFLILMILASTKINENDFEISVIGRWVILAILAIDLVGMHSIFLVETPSYSNIIKGFQGRYFILFLPCILLLFRNNGLIFKKKMEYLFPCFSMAQMVYLYFFLEMFMCG